MLYVNFTKELSYLLSHLDSHVEVKYTVVCLCLAARPHPRHCHRICRCAAYAYDFFVFRNSFLGGFGAYKKTRFFTNVLALFKLNFFIPSLSLCMLFVS